MRWTQLRKPFLVKFISKEQTFCTYGSNLHRNEPKVSAIRWKFVKIFAAVSQNILTDEARYQIEDLLKVLRERCQCLRHCG